MGTVVTAALATRTAATLQTRRLATMVRRNLASRSATRCAPGLVAMSRPTSVGARHVTLSASAAIALHIPSLVVCARTKAALQPLDASKSKGKASFCGVLLRWGDLVGRQVV